MESRLRKTLPAHVTVAKYCLALIFSFCVALVHAQGIITTIAGNGQFRFMGNGGPAADAPLGHIAGVATDPQGNVYAVDATNFIVVKIATTGILTIVAGNGTGGTGGDGRLATNASFVQPRGIAADAFGNLYLADGFRVRKVTPDGIISTVAGTDRGPHTGYSGEGGPAAQASLDFPQGIAVDAKGNLYIADGNRVLKVNAQGIISTVAGNGQCCYTGDGVPATSTALHLPAGVTVDQNGSLYIADTANDRIRRVGTDGIITTVAGVGGNGNGFGYGGDGGPATAAMLYAPNGIALDGSGNLYIADLLNNRVRRVSPDGIIRTIAGTGVANFTGDQGQASLATLNEPTGIAVNLSGDVYFGDSINYRVRKIDPLGTITTYAGNGNWDFAGEGGQARSAVLNNPSNVLADSAGNVFLSDTNNNRVRRIAPDGVITTVAGGSAGGFAGDGGPAMQALLNKPRGLALDSTGNLFIADSGNARVRKVDPGGTITTFAGNGASPASGNGDGGPAANASFNSVTDIAFDAKGNLYILDGFAHIRRVFPDGTITTFSTLQLFFATSISVDSLGNVYASLSPGSSGGPGMVIRISPDGATTAVLNSFFGPGKIAFDSQGNLYVPDGESRVFLLSPSGTETVVAGTGQAGFSGDEGPAALAQLGDPTAVALDSVGNLYIADSGNNRIRKVFLNPSSGLFQPTLQTTLQPGYYVASVTLGQGEHPGYWGMQVVAPDGVLAGGFNLGGTLQQRSLPPGFGAIYVPYPQAVHFHVNAQAADGSSSSTVGLGVQLLDASRNPVIGEQFGGTSVDFTQTLPMGFYIVEVRGGSSSPVENFQMGMITGQLAGGCVAGGFADANSVGFGAFYLTAPQQVSIQVFGQPSYGADGAGGLRLTLMDAKRKVIATAP